MLEFILINMLYILDIVVNLLNTIKLNCKELEINLLLIKVVILHVKINTIISYSNII